MHAPKLGGKSDKKNTNKNKPNDKVLHICDRLQTALSIGIRSSDRKTKIWWNTDAEIQGQVVRAANAFVTTLEPSNCKQPLIQSMLRDLTVALKGLLEFGNDQICSMSVAVTVKLTGLLGSSLFNYGIEELIPSLAQLLSCNNLTTALSCATALTTILKKLKPQSISHCNSKSGVRVLKVLEEKCALDCLVVRLQKYQDSQGKSEEYYAEFANLLSTILWRWPTLRYRIGSQNKLRIGLLNMSQSCNSSLASAALRVISALVLCKMVAMQLLDDDDVLLSVVRCLDKSKSCIIRIEALRLVKCLVRSESGYLKICGQHLQGLVKGIMEILLEWRLVTNDKWPPDLEALFMEASLTTSALLRWSGKHHSFFWNLNIANILSDLLLSSSDSALNLNFKGDKGSNATSHLNRHPTLQPHLWDILGWLAIHCEPRLTNILPEKNSSLARLISMACKMSLQIIQKRSQLHIQSCSEAFTGQKIPDVSERESICRTVLLLVNSPCKTLASRTESSLLESLQPYDHDWLHSLLKTLEAGIYRNRGSASDDLVMVVSVIALATFSSLYQYREALLKYNAVEILAHAIKIYSDRKTTVARVNVSSHVRDPMDDRTCCWDDMQDWDGKNLLLFFTLWSFARLVPNSDFARKAKYINFQDFPDDSNCEETGTRSFIFLLQYLVSDDNHSFGVRWYAACILSCFGIYGFTSELGKRMKKVYDNKVSANLLMFLSNGSSVYAHTFLLAARCPSLLPSTVVDANNNPNVPYEVQFSSKIHIRPLQKILEFIYSGTVQINDESEADVRLLAKRCNLEPLVSLLDGIVPAWGKPVPNYSLVTALDVKGHQFSDIIVQAEDPKESTTVCPQCPLSTEHFHANRVVLSSNCDYFEALFRSGMSDSFTDSVNVPIGWNALNKLMNFFYTGEINNCKSDCLWNSMSVEQHIEDLQGYLELSWIAEQWFLHNVKELCFSIVLQKLKWNHHLCPKVLKKAADLSQWDIVAEVAQFMAPIYWETRHQIEELDEQLLDILRCAHVHHVSQSEAAS